MILEAKVALATGVVAWAMAALAQSAPPTGVYIAFASLLISGVGVLLALLRAMSGYGREQGEMRTALAALKEQQENQISSKEVRLMMENTSLKIDALSTRMNDWTDAVTYDLRRLRESHRTSGHGTREDEEFARAPGGPSTTRRD